MESKFIRLHIPIFVISALMLVLYSCEKKSKITKSPNIVPWERSFQLIDKSETISGHPELKMHWYSIDENCNITLRLKLPDGAVIGEMQNHGKITQLKLAGENTDYIFNVESIADKYGREAKDIILNINDFRK